MKKKKSKPLTPLPQPLLSHSIDAWGVTGPGKEHCHTLLPHLQAVAFTSLDIPQCILLSVAFPCVCPRQFLCPPCSSEIVTFLKSPSQFFCRISFSRDLSNALTDEIGGLRFWQGEHRDQCPAASLTAHGSVNCNPKARVV